MILPALAACGGQRHSQAAGQQPAQPTTVGVSTVDGVSFISLAALDGQVLGHRSTVLLFTAPGCESCAAEARALTKALGSHPPVQLVGVDMSPDPPADLAKYLKAIGVADSPFVWTVDTNSALTGRYQVAALSSSVGIDHSGRVRFLNQGPADSTELLRQIAALS